MSGKKLLRGAFALVAGLALLPGLAQARAALRVLPVTLQGYVGSEIKVQLSLPCGSRYYGLLVAPHKDVIKVAAVVLQEAVSCTTMPETVTVRADYLATASFRSVSPLAVRESQRLRMVPIEQLQRSGESSVLAVYAARCGVAMGVLVHRVGAQRLELAMAEALTDHASAKVCSSSPKLLPLTALAVAERTQVAALREVEAGLKRSFKLRLAPVDVAATLGHGGDAGLHVVYQRQCNEAPIGLVLGHLQSAPTNDRGVIRVGVLVAQYPNLRCGDDQTGPTWQTLSEGALRIPAGVGVAALTAGDSGLRLRVPSRLMLSARGQALQSLEISYFNGCEAEYAVYGRDRQGVLAVGVLAVASLQAASGGSRCKKELSEVSFQQPYVVPSVQARELYPMRLKGM